MGEVGFQNNNTFSNNAGGSITINQVSFTGLFNTNGSTFTNLATIIIGAVAEVGQYGILNTASFQNIGCGAINIVANAVILNNGTFGNTGTIIENAFGDSNISSNSGFVQNLNGGNVNIGNDTGVLTTAPGLFWTGCVSRDWNSAGNWASGIVPTATDNVVISDLAPNQPVIGAGTPTWGIIVS